MLSAGARRCFEILSDLDRGPLGACPSRAWLAERLGCPLRTLDRWTAELRNAGMITIKKRQHHSAVYLVQKSVEIAENGKSGGKSGGKSEHRYIGRVLNSGEEKRCLTVENIWGKRPATSEEMAEWMKTG